VAWLLPKTNLRVPRSEKTPHGPWLERCWSVPTSSAEPGLSCEHNRPSETYSLQHPVRWQRAPLGTEHRSDAVLPMRRGVPGLLAYFFRTYPARSVSIVALSILAGFAEGFGIATVLPLLEVASRAPDSSDSALMSMIRSVLDVVGLEPTLGVLSALVVGGMFMKGAFLWLVAQQTGYAVANVATDLRLSLIDALLRARWSYFVGQKSGHMSNAVGTEANAASMAYANACRLLAMLVQILVFATIAFLIAPLVALGAIVVGGVIALLFLRLVRMSQRAGERQTLLLRSLSGRLVDAIQGLKPIKAMAQEEHLQPLLESETRDVNESKRREVLAGGTMSAFHEPILVLVLMAGLYVTMTATDVVLSGLLVMAFLFHRLVGRIHQAQMAYQSLAVSESAFWSLRDAIQLAVAQREQGTGTSQTPSIKRGIRLDDVVFSYNGGTPVLRGASLEIPVGKFVSIVGPSGAGKTTIIDVVIGLLRPDAGEMYIDDVPLAEIDLVSWRKSIGYVPQEMLLFHNSIYNNVTLGDDSIPREAVAEALEQAGAAAFVARLPDGMDTVIGASGSGLSGGERQRIAIARALVRRPQLLVLDEVTTALDPETEAAICRTLRGIAGDVTILAISHQPAIANVSDIVYRLQEGRVHGEEQVARVAGASAVES
jgi:ATP-binding cassette, subfamily C, bacterial